MAYRGDAPGYDRGRQPSTDADPVDDPTGGEKAERIREAEPRDDVPVIGLGPMELTLERRREDSEDLTVDVIDRRRDEEQRADRPPIRRRTCDSAPVIHR